MIINRPYISHSDRRGVAFILIMVFLLILFPSVLAEAQEGSAVQSSPLTLVTESNILASTKDLAISKAIRPPELKDILNGKIPSDFEAMTDFRQFSPGDGTPVSQKTSAAISYNSQNLYVIFICQDDPEKVRGRMSKRENISDDDSVTVYLDTFHEGQSAYYFSANPLGIQADGIRTTEEEEDERFDTLWYSDGGITDFGYVVLITIPFKSLHFSNDFNQKWGIALSRKIIRYDEEAFLPFITSRKSSFLQQLGTIELTGLASGYRIQVIPNATYTRARLLDDSGSEYDTEEDFRGGVDAKLLLRNALTFDLTYNPDYSQVESDDPQETVNKRFEVEFPEKRPFFLDNINYFQTPLKLFYTRRIADPEFGVRMTGKIRQWNLGVVGIDDRLPGDLADEDSPLFGKRAINGVTRVQYRLGRDSNMGLLATGRSFEETKNTVFAADTRLGLTQTWNFTGQMAFSKDDSYYDQDDTTTYNGQAYFANLAYGSRNIQYALNYEDISPDFKADLGIIERTDIRKASQFASYYFYPENSKIQYLGPSLNLGINWDHAGEIQDKNSYLDFSIYFNGPIGFTITRYDAYERFLSREFNYNYTEFSFYANWIKKFSFNGGVSVGTEVNYSPPEGVDPFVGDVLSMYFGFNWRPTKKISIESSYNYKDFSAPQDWAEQSRMGNEVFNNQYNRTKLNIQFTKPLSLRFIVDYYFLSSNPELFDSQDLEQLEFDVLLTYMLHPFTALYIGYNSGYENYGEDLRAFNLHHLASSDNLNHEQFFVKLSYRFDLL